MQRCQTHSEAQHEGLVRALSRSAPAPAPASPTLCPTAAATTRRISASRSKQVVEAGHAESSQLRPGVGGQALISAASGLAIQELNQPCFRTCKPLPLFAGKRSEGVDQDPLSRDVHHVAVVDPATGTPGESDAPLEHGGLGRMESVLVRADGRSAGGTDPAVPVGDRVPGPDLAPVLPPGRCSSSRHAQHSLPRRVARHSRPGEAGAGPDRKPGPLQAGTIARTSPEVEPTRAGKARPVQTLNANEGAPARLRRDPSSVDSRRGTRLLDDRGRVAR